jgi:hypothetical protein
MSHTGWYVGYVIAFVLIQGIVICVSIVLNLARRIGVQSREISMVILSTGVQTDPMRTVATINKGTESVVGGLSRVRAHLYGREGS